MHKTIAILVLLLFISCTVPAKEPTQAEPVRIGVIGSMTGPAAVFGEAFAKGVQQAADEINANGTKVALIVDDNRNDAKEGINAYQRLQMQQPAVILTQGSSPSVAIAPLVKEQGTPLLGTLTTAQFQADYANSFNYYLGASDNARALVPFLQKKEVRTVAFYYVSAENGVNGINPVEEKLLQEGFIVLAKEGYPPTETDHRQGIAKIAAKNPDAIYIWATRPDQVVEAAKANYKGIIIFNEIPITMRQYRQSDAFNGTYGLAMAYAVPGTPESTAFNEKFGEDQNGYAAFGYDLMMLAWNNGNVAGAVNDIAMQSTHAGLVGTVTVDASARKISMPLQVLHIQNRTLSVE